MIDVAIAIDGEAVSVTRTRSASGSYDANGDWTAGASTSVGIMAVVQPVKGNQLMDMPEGIRTEAGWIVWSRSDMAVDDRITDDGKTYRVLFAWPRTRDGDFYRAALGLVA
ncbi:hypothetical protein [Hoeflea alexandrii]|uniref:Head-tail adaptor protein n=1 Tax=Hoeflea alexandrii TaxID=288436 RepID=A0ABT1CP49_9HYPH|nr:hypothetical protein [Hoeflea alexandrii]MCO6407360.1 hypothetical protein [Hoeflea alexandrii]MCY0154243.1 hypothetical protein [Hoeflea alexandrii]